MNAGRIAVVSVVSLVLLVFLASSLSCGIVEKVMDMVSGEVADAGSGPIPADRPTIGDTIQDGSLEVMLHKARFGGSDRR